MACKSTGQQHYLIVGDASTDGSIDDTIQHHAKRVDFQRSIGKVLFYQRLDLLIGFTQRLDCQLQWAHLKLQTTVQHTCSPHIVGSTLSR